ncbi:MAG: hypothetical protein IPO92_11645 [Saprospiraceae bacterium]|nr:hypothetical protein [Saprospiraceae bacterium]
MNKQKIDEFTPVNLIVQAKTEPYPTITIIFDNDNDPIIFKSKFLDNSGLKLTILKTERGGYLSDFKFPKNENYSFGMESPPTENSTYESILDKTIAITCGFQRADGMIVVLPNPYILDNKISPN